MSSARPLAGRYLRQTADITWLQPTAQNLAKLTVPVPAGFRRVPLAKGVLPFLQQIPGAPLAKPKALCLGFAGPMCEGQARAFGSGPEHAGHP